MKKTINLFLITGLLAQSGFADVWDTVKKGADYFQQGKSYFNRLTGQAGASGSAQRLLSNQSFMFVGKLGCANQIPQKGLNAAMICSPGEDLKSIKDKQVALGSLLSQGFDPNAFKLCMSDGLDIYKKKIQDRIDTINKQWQTIQDSYDNFKQSVLDPQLKSLKDDQQNLYGPLNLDSNLAGARARTFLSAQACASIKPYQDFEQATSKGGLKALTEGNDFGKIITDTNSFRKDPNIVTRIQAFINNEVIKARSEGFQNFAKSEVPERDGLAKTLSVTTSYQTAMHDIKSTYQSELDVYKKQLNNYLDTTGSDKDIYDALVNSQGEENLNHIETTWRNRRSTECLQNTFTGGQQQMQSILGTLADPLAENHRRQRGTRSGRTAEAQELSDTINEILSNKKTSISQKTRSINSEIQKSERGSKMYIYLGKGFNGKADSHRWSIQELFGSIVESCKRGDSEANRTNNRSIGSIFKKVRAIKHKINNHKKNYLSNLKKQLSSRLLTCEQSIGQEESRACGQEDAFRVQGNFCYEKARHCVTNVDNCLGRIKHEVTRKESQVKVTVANLNVSIKNFVAQQHNLFKAMNASATQFMEQEKDLLNIDFDFDLKFNNSDIEQNKDSEYSTLTKELGVEIINSDPEMLLGKFEENKNQIIKALKKGKESLEGRTQKVMGNVSSVLSSQGPNIEKAMEACNKAEENRTEHDAKCKKIAADLTEPDSGTIGTLMSDLNDFLHFNPEGFQSEDLVKELLELKEKITTSDALQSCQDSLTITPAEEKEIESLKKAVSRVSSLPVMDIKVVEEENTQVQDAQEKLETSNTLLKECLKEGKGECKLEEKNVKDDEKNLEKLEEEHSDNKRCSTDSEQSIKKVIQAIDANVNTAFEEGLKAQTGKCSNINKQYNEKEETKEKDTKKSDGKSEEVKEG